MSQIMFQEASYAMKSESRSEISRINNEMILAHFQIPEKNADYRASQNSQTEKLTPSDPICHSKESESDFPDISSESNQDSFQFNIQLGASGIVSFAPISGCSSIPQSNDMESLKSKRFKHSIGKYESILIQSNAFFPDKSQKRASFHFGTRIISAINIYEKTPASVALMEDPKTIKIQVTKRRY